MMRGLALFAAASVVAVAYGCSSSGGNSGTGGSAGASTGGTSNAGGTSSGTGGTSPGAGGTSSGTGGTSPGTGGSGTGGSAGGGTCTSGQTTTCDQVELDQAADGGPGACTTCAQSSCCTAINACFGDPACVGFNDCLNTNCANASDLQACATQSCSQCMTQTVINEFNAIGTCLQSSCDAECGGADAGAAGSGP
jgi:hypothetical protein